jgi:hypothetical protein
MDETMKISDETKREYIDRLNIIGGFIDQLLLHHPISSYNLDFKDKVEEAAEILWDVYVTAQEQYDNKTL